MLNLEKMRKQNARIIPDKMSWKLHRFADTTAITYAIQWFGHKMNIKHNGVGEIQIFRTPAPDPYDENTVTAVFHRAVYDPNHMHIEVKM